MLNEPQFAKLVGRRGGKNNALLEQLESVIEKGLVTFIEVGEALYDIREHELWKLPGLYSSWQMYLVRRWNFGRSRASQLISAAQRARRVEGVHGLKIKNERVARQLNTILKEYNESVQELALDALSKRSGELTPERLRNELDILVEYKTTGHVTTGNGDQSALDNAIKTGRKEAEIAKRRYIVQNIEVDLDGTYSGSFTLDSIPFDVNAAKILEKASRVHVSVWIEET